MAMSKLKESVVETVDDVTLLDQESEDDVLEIVGAVSRITAKYRQLGIGLGLLPGKIDEIEKKRKTSSSVRDKFSEVITLRLDQLPAPTWKTFIDAAKPINPALAERVARTVPGDTTLDVRMVTEKFKSISAKYYQFGANLKVPTFELDGIRSEMSIHDLLHDVVLEFLTSHREKYKPTWRTIVDAVFDINPALAKEIADKHKAPSTPLEEEVSGSQVDQSTQLPATSILSAGTKRKATGTPDCDTTDGNTDNDDSSPPSKKIKVSNSVQDTPSPAAVSKTSNSESQQVCFELCGIDKLKDEPLQLPENAKKFLPRALLQLDCVTGATPLNGKGVEIVILDSGIFLEHGVFASKREGRIDGHNFVSTDPPDSWHTKPELHGTAMAAIVAGNEYSSSKGPCVGGIAPSANLYICRIFSQGKTTMLQNISALNHLIDLKQESKDRVDVIVMSFGKQQKDTEIEKKLKRLADLGVVLVAAGGNDGPRPDDTFFPSSDNHVISVGALNENGGYKTNFSATHCHVYAPGESIIAPSLANNSTTDVCPVDGTSFAAPILAGFLALLLQSANNSGNDFVINKCHDINFLNTLLRDHKLVKDDKLWYANEVVQRLQDDSSFIIKLVKDQYGNEVP